jgi:hypothetical protein
VGPPPLKPGGGGAPPLKPGGGGAPPLKNDRLRLLKVVSGRVTEIASAPIEIDVEFERQQPTPGWGWYALRVRHAGDRIAVWFQDANVIDVRDSTFTAAGRVGLITHGDTVAVFDDLHVQLGSGGYVPPARTASVASTPPVMHVADVFTFDPARELSCLLCFSFFVFRFSFSLVPVP